MHASIGISCPQAHSRSGPWQLESSPCGSLCRTSCFGVFCTGHPVIDAVALACLCGAPAQRRCVVPEAVQGTEKGCCCATPNLGSLVFHETNLFASFLTAFCAVTGHNICFWLAAPVRFC